MKTDLRRTTQLLLSGLRYYKGNIDGKDSDEFDEALNIVLRNMKRPEILTWPRERQEVAGIQRMLTSRGAELGPIDGWMGTNTDGAITAYYHDLAGIPFVIKREPEKPAPKVPSSDIPTQAECPKYYGDPAKGEVEERLDFFILPFPMRLDWDLGSTVNRVRLHRLAGPSFIKAMKEVLAAYGIEQIRQLGIDRFAGSYVHRSMRGGTSWSMHAYGCAVDIYAAPNGLTTRCPKALFCKPEYKEFLDIMQMNEWLPAIRLWGADAMHFQRARL